MNAKYVFPTVLGLVAVITTIAFFLTHGHNVGLLDPQGIIAQHERALMIEAALLMLIVVVPVFLLTFGFAWYYRASNTRAEYRPNWEHNPLQELIWWAVPMVIVAALAVIAWRSAHTLDPFRPIDSSVPPLTIEVVSLDWKWLFIYPAQGIASVNYLAIPEKTPIAFKLTSDAPMNAFWIPQLGGQEMTMPGMITQLHLMADATGTYQGFSSNISGTGFASMHFPVHSVTASDFTAWTAHERVASSTLSFAAFQALAQPSTLKAPLFYRVTDPRLYTKIVMQFMQPAASSTTPMATMPQ